MSRSRKKKKALPPRAKRMKRAARLQSARTWLAKYKGENVVRGYRKHFGVDFTCAFIELEMLGVQVDPGYKATVMRSLQHSSKARQRKKQTAEDELWSDSDETYAYIAGYTSGGMPYGVTWEEMWDNCLSGEG
ncbi:MAG: hypothetical protein ACKV2V_04435 [Blastocatellia bacterium]